MKTEAGARDPLQSLADEHGLTLDELKEKVRTIVDAEIGLVSWHARVRRYQAAAEECMRAYAAIEGNEKGEQGARFIGRLLGVRGIDPFLGRPQKRPWVLAVLAECESLLGVICAQDGEDRDAVERRILLEFGASPNEIAASRDPARDGPVRSYADTAIARKARRDVERIRRTLRAEISELQQKRQSLDDPPADFELGHLAVASHLDEKIEEYEGLLARLNARRRS